MERTPETIEERMARLEGQYHALSKDLTDGLGGRKETLDNLREQVEGLTKVKGGMLKSESLSDVIGRMDGRLDEMQKQIVAISNALQVK
jgi:archaellum component FlaC